MVEIGEDGGVEVFCGGGFEEFVCVGVVVVGEFGLFECGEEWEVVFVVDVGGEECVVCGGGVVGEVEGVVFDVGVFVFGGVVYFW